jgi:hypothetical protein
VYMVRGRIQVRQGSVMAIKDTETDAEARQIEETERSERMWRLTIYMMSGAVVVAALACWVPLH